VKKRVAVRLIPFVNTASSVLADHERKDAPPMRRSSALSLLTVAIAGGILFAACSSAAGAPPASGVPIASPSAPSATPVVRPSASPSADPVQTPRPEPTDGGAGGDLMPIKVDLITVDENSDVYVDIVDESGRIDRAESGIPDEGASIGTGEIRATNVDARTIRLLWSDLPGDNALALYVDEAASRLLLVQPEHDGDAIALDRVLILHFDREVDAEDLEVGIQEGLDTAAE
jgi:hypothetical protein